MIIMSMTTKIIKPYLNSEHSFLYRFRLFSSVWKIDISCHLWLFFDRNSLKMLFIAQLFKISACMIAWQFWWSWRQLVHMTWHVRRYVDYNHNFAFCFQWRNCRSRNISERRYLLNITHSVCIFTFIRARLRLNNFNLKILGQRARG